MEDDQVFAMLYEAVERLPDQELAALASRFLPPEVFRVSVSGELRVEGLVAEVCALDFDARHGAYYVPFSVNSKNSMDLSKGTRGFIAEYCRLLDRCVKDAECGQLEEVRTAMTVLFTLLRDVSTGAEDILFFADEGGLWLFGIGWPAVLKIWFRCLALSATPKEYGRGVISTIDDFDDSRRACHLETAMELADESQRQALRILTLGS